MATASCVTCSHPKRAEIDELLHGGASFRSVGTRFGLTKDAVGRHARAHLGIVNVDPKSRRNAKRRVQRRVLQAVRDVPPLRLDTADDVIAELKVLYAEGRAMLEGAHAAGDTRLAEKSLSNALAILERIGRAFGAFQADAAVVVDRSQRILNVVAGLSDDELRALVRGEPIALPALHDEVAS